MQTSDFNRRNNEETEEAEKTSPGMAMGNNADACLPISLAVLSSLPAKHLQALAPFLSQQQSQPGSSPNPLISNLLANLPADSPLRSQITAPPSTPNNRNSSQSQPIGAQSPILGLQAIPARTSLFGIPPQSLNVQQESFPLDALEETQQQQYSVSPHYANGLQPSFEGTGAEIPLQYGNGNENGRGKKKTNCNECCAPVCSCCCQSARPQNQNQSNRCTTRCNKFPIPYLPPHQKYACERKSRYLFDSNDLTPAQFEQLLSTCCAPPCPPKSNRSQKRRIRLPSFSNCRNLQSKLKLQQEKQLQSQLKIPGDFNFSQPLSYEKNLELQQQLQQIQQRLQQQQQQQEEGRLPSNSMQVGGEPSGISLGQSQGMGLGPSSVGLGQSPLGIGPSTLGLGQSSLGLGPSSLGIGPSALGLGQSSLGLGQSSLGLGQSSLGLGQSPLGIGPSSLGIGPSSLGIGPSSLGIGPSSLGIGPSSLGIGPSSYGLGQSSLGLGPSSLGLGPSSVGLGPSTLGLGFGMGGPSGSYINGKSGRKRRGYSKGGLNGPPFQLGQLEQFLFDPAASSILGQIPAQQSSIFTPGSRSTIQDPQSVLFNGSVPSMNPSTAFSQPNSIKPSTTSNVGVNSQGPSKVIVRTEMSNSFGVQVNSVEPDKSIQTVGFTIEREESNTILYVDEGDGNKGIQTKGMLDEPMVSTQTDDDFLSIIGPIASMAAASGFNLSMAPSIPLPLQLPSLKQSTKSMKGYSTFQDTNAPSLNPSNPFFSTSSINPKSRMNTTATSKTSANSKMSAKTGNDMPWKKKVKLESTATIHPLISTPTMSVSMTSELPIKISSMTTIRSQSREETTVEVSAPGSRRSVSPRKLISNRPSQQLDLDLDLEPSSTSMKSKMSSRPSKTSTRTTIPFKNENTKSKASHLSKYEKSIKDPSEILRSRSSSPVSRMESKYSNSRTNATSKPSEIMSSNDPSRRNSNMTSNDPSVRNSEYASNPFALNSEFSQVMLKNPSMMNSIANNSQMFSNNPNPSVRTMQNNQAISNQTMQNGELTTNPSVRNSEFMSNPSAAEMECRPYDSMLNSEFSQMMLQNPSMKTMKNSQAFFTNPSAKISEFLTNPSAGNSEFFTNPTARNSEFTTIPSVRNSAPNAFLLNSEFSQILENPNTRNSTLNNINSQMTSKNPSTKTMQNSQAFLTNPSAGNSEFFTNPSAQNSEFMSIPSAQNAFLLNSEFSQILENPNTRNSTLNNINSQMTSKNPSMKTMQNSQAFLTNPSARNSEFTSIPSAQNSEFMSIPSAQNAFLLNSEFSQMFKNPNMMNSNLNNSQIISNDPSMRTMRNQSMKNSQISNQVSNNQSMRTFPPESTSNLLSEQDYEEPSVVDTTLENNTRQNALYQTKPISRYPVGGAGASKSNHRSRRNVSSRPSSKSRVASRSQSRSRSSSKSPSPVSNRSRSLSPSPIEVQDITDQKGQKMGGLRSRASRNKNFDSSVSRGANNNANVNANVVFKISSTTNTAVDINEETIISPGPAIGPDVEDEDEDEEKQVQEETLGRGILGDFSLAGLSQGQQMALGALPTAAISRRGLTAKMVKSRVCMKVCAHRGILKPPAQQQQEQRQQQEKVQNPAQDLLPAEQQSQMFTSNGMGPDGNEGLRANRGGSPSPSPLNQQGGIRGMNNSGNPNIFNGMGSPMGQFGQSSQYAGVHGVPNQKFGSVGPMTMSNNETPTPFNKNSNNGGFGPNSSSMGSSLSPNTNTNPNQNPQNGQSPSFNFPGQNTGQNSNFSGAPSFGQNNNSSNLRAQSPAPINGNNNNNNNNAMMYNNNNSNSSNSNSTSGKRRCPCPCPRPCPCPCPCPPPACQVVTECYKICPPPPPACFCCPCPCPSPPPPIQNPNQIQNPAMNMNQICCVVPTNSNAIANNDCNPYRARCKIGCRTPPSISTSNCPNVPNFPNCNPCNKPLVPQCSYFQAQPSATPSCSPSRSPSPSPIPACQKIPNCNNLNNNVNSNIKSCNRNTLEEYYLVSVDELENEDCTPNDEILMEEDTLLQFCPESNQYIMCKKPTVCPKQVCARKKCR